MKKNGFPKFLLEHKAALKKYQKASNWIICSWENKPVGLNISKIGGNFKSLGSHKLFFEITLKCYLIS